MSSKVPLAHASRRSQQALDGLAFSSLATLVQGIGQIVVLAVLARYVSKVEFGLVTTTLIVIGLGRIMSETLVRPVLVQTEQLSEQDVATASTLSLLFGVGFTAILWWLAAPIGRLLHEPDIIPVIRTLSFVMVLQAPANVAEGLMQRELGFKGMAAAEVLSFSLGYAAVGVTLALAQAGVWALVCAYLAQVAVKTLFLVWRRPDSLRLAFYLSSARKILWLSGGFISARLFGYGATQGDYVVVASAMGSEAVGIYGRAYHLLSMLATLIGQSLDRVMFPIYARLQEDLAQAANHYRRAVALSATLVAPISVLMIVLAPEIVRLVLGPDWPETVTPLRILAASLLFRTGYKLNDPLTKGLGLVYNRAWRLALYAAAVALGALLGVRWGLAGVSAGVSCAIVLNFFLMAQLSIRSVNITWLEFLGLHIRGATIAICILPLAGVTANLLRSGDVAYPGVLLGVLAITAVSWLIVAALRPDLAIGSEMFWLARLLGARFNPGKTTAAPQNAAAIKHSILVEVHSVPNRNGQSFVGVILEQLGQQGIPATEAMLHEQYKSAGAMRVLNNFLLLIRAFHRAPRTTIFQCLTLLGMETRQSNTVGNVLSFLADSERLAKCRTKPGVHIFVRGPLSVLRSINQDATYGLKPSSLQGLFQLNQPDLFVDVRASTTSAERESSSHPLPVGTGLQKFQATSHDNTTKSARQTIEQWISAADSTGDVPQFVNITLAENTPRECAAQVVKWLESRWSSSK